MSRAFTNIMTPRARKRAARRILRWRIAARLGLCRHPATMGPAGGDEGLCLVCGKTVPWDDGE